MSEWNKASDRPDDDGVYICLFNDGTIETFEYVAEDHAEIWGAGKYTVTHWIDVPEFEI